MLTIKDVDKRLAEMQVPYGYTVCFPKKIDTQDCEEFFGIRCNNNIHVVDEYCAHKDEYDPRYFPWKHLERDVGIHPVVITTLSSAIIGAGIGASLDKKDRMRGAITGACVLGFFGLLLGLAITS